jgi:Sap, sulfolipid-1-addressing protein
VQVVLDLLLIGLGITLAPFPVTAFILILSAEQGARKGLAFILGWLACLLLVIAAVVLVTGGKPPAPNTAPSTAALAVKLALGIVLIGIRRAAVAPDGPPTSAADLDGEAGPALAVGGSRARRVPSAVGAGGGRRRDGHPGQALHRRGLPDLVLFVLLATSSFLCLELYTAFAPAAAGARLERLRKWLDIHRDQVIIALSLLLGCWLAGKSSYLLVS